LAADLRRHLASLPLGGVANRSLGERWRKWRRRRPLAMPLATLGIAATLVIGIAAGILYRDRIRGAEALLRESQRELGIKDFKHSVQHAYDALGNLRWFPWQADLKDQIEAQIVASKRGKAADSLHKVAEQFRLLDPLQLSETDRNNYAAECEWVWKNRETLTPRPDSSVGGPTDAQPDEQLRHDLLELAAFYSRLEVRRALPVNAAAARKQAKKILDEAEELCGRSIILDLARRDCLPAASSDAERASADKLPDANNAWEHYALGRWLMQRQLLDEAERHFAAAVELRPNDFWTWFQSARCEFELGRMDEALAAAKVCVALSPQRPECYYNRGLCYAALRRDQEALADFGRALKMGSPPSEVHYQIARLHLARNDIVSARKSLNQSLAEDRNNVAALALDRELATKGK
jgi:tetratricopeptide (TPR) repeat protein